MKTLAFFKTAPQNFRPVRLHFLLKRIGKTFLFMSILRRMNVRLRTWFQLPVEFQQPIPLLCRLKTIPVKAPMTTPQRSEQTVEPEKTDSEVCVHAAFVVHRAVVNVMKPARSAKPDSDDGGSCHPEVLQMHAIVQITEHEDRPGDESHERDCFINWCNPGREHDPPARKENQSRRCEPLQPNVADRKTAVRRIVIFVVPHSLRRSVNQEVMNKMALA